VKNRPVERQRPVVITGRRPAITGPAPFLPGRRPAVAGREPPEKKRGLLRLVANVTFVVVVSLGVGLALQRVPVPTGFFTNAAPRVIPSLREWRGGNGSFTIGAASRIVVDPASSAQLADTAQLLRGELFQISFHLLDVITIAAPAKGDLFLTLQSTDRGIGAEGYLLDVGDTATIRANTRTGVFYGTRTLLQILVQDGDHSTLPRGTARDYPKYRERGFMLDVGRKFFSLSFLEDYVRFMAWFKMNDFHLHLNDNEIGGGNAPNWQGRYAAFRLNSDKFKGLAAKDGSYTQQDMRQLQDLAAAYGVTITPEIDAPAHALALTQFRPDLASPAYEKDFLDLNNPNTYTFMNSLWDEFAPWFDAPQVSIGADEYAASDADNYRQFINRYDDYLKGKGKSIRMWGSLSAIRSNIPVNTDVTIEVWNNGWANPIDMVHQGYNIINANDDLLYIVPKVGYYQDYLDTKRLYEKWEPNVFDLSNPGFNLDPTDPHLLGGMFAVWNDRLGSSISDADVHARVKPAMSTLGEKMWSGTTSGTSYDDFRHLAAKLGDGPGTHLPQVGG